MSQPPTKPGFYWAKLDGGSWEIVEVRKDHHGTLVTDMTGTDDDFSISRFTFGPEVTKPEGLE